MKILKDSPFTERRCNPSMYIDELTAFINANEKYAELEREPTVSKYTDYERYKQALRCIERKLGNVGVKIRTSKGRIIAERADIFLRNENEEISGTNHRSQDHY